MNEPNIPLESQAFLVVSDVHSDSESLKQILETVGNVRYRCFLGDAIGPAVHGGMRPKETLELCKVFNIGILGNHDYDALLHPGDIEADDAQNITKADTAILRELAPTFQRSGLLLCHATPRDIKAYPYNEGDITSIMEQHNDVDVFIAGHLHLPRLAYYDRKTDDIGFERIYSKFSRHTLDLKARRYFVNCPSAIEGRFKGTGHGCVLLDHISERLKILNFYFMQER